MQDSARPAVGHAELSCTACCAAHAGVQENDWPALRAAVRYAYVGKLDMAVASHAPLLVRVRPMGQYSVGMGCLWCA